VGASGRSRDIVAQNWPETAGARRKLAENGRFVQRTPASGQAFCVARSVLKGSGV
jgi:hypothetical protein